MVLFDYIYIEEAAENYPLPKEIIKKMKGARIITIKDYKEVFSRPGQDYHLQKKSQKLILAVKKKNFLYELPPICQNFGVKNSYYASPALNCVYECGYCFLQGMYPSANITVFVNTEDFFKETKRLLKSFPISLAVSYDTDLLALENILGLASEWIGFAYENPGLTLEIRTKSVNTGVFIKNKPSPDIIPAWTLLPEEIISRYEKSTPSLSSRLNAVKKIMEIGWKVRLCFDPLMMIPGLEKIYPDFIKKVFTKLPVENIRDVSVGVFRMNEVFFKKMKNSSLYSGILNKPFMTENGIVAYQAEYTRQLKNSMLREIINYLPEEKIFF